MHDILYYNRYYRNKENYPINFEDILAQETFTRNVKVIYGVVHEYFNRIRVNHGFSIINHLLHTDFLLLVDNSINTIVVEIPNFKFERREKIWYVGGGDSGLITPNPLNVSYVYYDEIFSIYDAFKFIYKGRLRTKTLV